VIVQAGATDIAWFGGLVLFVDPGSSHGVVIEPDCYALALNRGSRQVFTFQVKCCAAKKAQQYYFRAILLINGSWMWFSRPLMVAH